jgi:hypothetical protein
MDAEYVDALIYAQMIVLLGEYINARQQEIFNINEEINHLEESMIRNEEDFQNVAHTEEYHNCLCKACFSAQCHHKRYLINNKYEEGDKINKQYRIAQNVFDVLKPPIVVVAVNHQVIENAAKSNMDFIIAEATVYDTRIDLEISRNYKTAMRDAVLARQNNPDADIVIECLCRKCFRDADEDIEEQEENLIQAYITHDAANIHFTNERDIAIRTILAL